METNFNYEARKVHGCLIRFAGISYPGRPPVHRQFIITSWAQWVGVLQESAI